MMQDSREFEFKRWHNPEYVDSWIANQAMEEQRIPMRKLLISFLPFAADAPIRVLDVGAGTGALSLEVLNTHPNAMVVCHDFSATMLAHARARLAKFPGQVTFVESDLQNPAWTRGINGTFDAVVTSMSLHTVTNRNPAIYREVFGLLKPGGCFLNCDHAGPSGPLFLAAYVMALRDKIKAETDSLKSLDEVREEFEERRQTSAGSHPDGVDSEALGDPSVMQHLEWLKQSSFDEVDCT
jgi:ubiquinone/menaquinone biosynthesis C-methylase UbiE